VNLQIYSYNLRYNIYIYIYIMFLSKLLSSNYNPSMSEMCFGYCTNVPVGYF
ncbi:unnamed protein product, partial [Musa textilis]